MPTEAIDDDLDTLSETTTGDDLDTVSETPTRAGSRRPAVLGLAVLVAAVLVALFVFAIGLGSEHREASAAADRDHSVIEAVRSATLDLISPTYREPDVGADRIVAAATGEWLAEFEATRQRFVGAVADSRTEAVGEILGVGIERHDPDGSTVVLVSAVSKVTNSAGASDDPRTWRLRVVVVPVDGGYKLADVEVVP